MMQFLQMMNMIYLHQCSRKTIIFVWVVLAQMISEDGLAETKFSEVSLLPQIS